MGCMLLCCCGRSFPVNYGLLFLFTVCMSYMLGSITSRYEPKIVTTAFAATGLVTISLTIYACRAKEGIFIMGGLLFTLIFAFIPLIIMGVLIGLKFLHTIICAFGAIIYTMIICGKEKHNGIAFDHNDHVIGALILYID